MNLHKNLAKTPSLALWTLTLIKNASWTLDLEHLQYKNWTKELLKK